MFASRRARKARIKLAVSTIGSWKTVPIELRTALRKNGLHEVSPTIKVWTLKAAQLRASAPIFSALDRLSAATNSLGFGERLTISSKETGAGTLPRASN